MSLIDGFLNKILTAIYGEEVRGAIHDAIKQCYDDVSSGATLIDQAAADANEAAERANSEAEELAELKSETETAAMNARTGATLAQQNAKNAEDAAAAANKIANMTVDAESTDHTEDADVELRDDLETGNKILRFGIPRGHPGVYIGTEAPTDPKIKVWINPEGESDEETDGVSEEQIQSAVNLYLNENPIKPGATAEQAAQIEENKNSIDYLKEHGLGTPGRGIADITSDYITGTPVTVRYTDGTGQVFYVREGRDGEPGKSPNVEFRPIEGGHMLYFESDGVLTFFEVLDGKTGPKGDDYILTNDDKAEIAGMVVVPPASSDEIKNAVNEFFAQNPASGTSVYIGPDQPIDGTKYWLDTSENVSNDPIEPGTYLVETNLLNCVCNSSGIEITEGASYSATLTAEEGYVLSSVTITMGGADITGSNYDGATGQIYIPSVTGDIVITAEATEQAAGVVTYSITNNLVNCVTSNSALAAEEGTAYTATITAADGYTLANGAVSITMSGVDITANVYADGVITIASVTGDIVINATAAAVADISSFILDYEWLKTVRDIDIANGTTADYSAKNNSAVIMNGTSYSSMEPITAFFETAPDPIYLVTYFPNRADQYGVPIQFWKPQSNNGSGYYTDLCSGQATLASGLSDDYKVGWSSISKATILAAVEAAGHTVNDVHRILATYLSSGAKNYDTRAVWMATQPTTEQMNAVREYFEQGGE